MKKSNFIDKKIKVGKFTARVIDADNPSSVDVTPEDKELDLRATAAVKAAIKRARSSGVRYRERIVNGVRYREDA